MRPQVWFDLTSVNLARAETHYAETVGAATAARYFRVLADRIDERGPRQPQGTADRATVALWER
jgi:hypothetical protein